METKKKPEWFKDDSPHSRGCGYVLYTGYAKFVTIQWDTLGWVALLNSDGDVLIEQDFSAEWRRAGVTPAQAAQKTATKLWYHFNSVDIGYFLTTDKREYLDSKGI